MPRGFGQYRTLIGRKFRSGLTICGFSTCRDSQHPYQNLLSWFIPKGRYRCSGFFPSARRTRDRQLHTSPIKKTREPVKRFHLLALTATNGLHRGGDPELGVGFLRRLKPSFSGFPDRRACAIPESGLCSLAEPQRSSGVNGLERSSIRPSALSMMPCPSQRQAPRSTAGRRMTCPRMRARPVAGGSNTANRSFWSLLMR